MLLPRGTWPPLPQSTGLLCAAFAGVAFTLASLLQARGAPAWWAALVAVPAAPVLWENQRRVIFYNRIARLLEHGASRALCACVLCQQRPRIESRARGRRGTAWVQCPCGVVLEMCVRSPHPAPAVQMRKAAIEQAVERWNSDTYRAALRDVSNTGQVRV